jgi:hypothetical protein
VLQALGDAVEEMVTDKLEQHVSRYHVPPRSRKPVSAIPFADIDVTDEQCARAHELMHAGRTVHDIAAILDLPLLRLELALADYSGRCGALLQARARR